MCKKRAKTCKNVQKHASQMFLDPIQKRALSRSVHLEAVYFEALLYNGLVLICTIIWFKIPVKGR